MKKKVIVDTDPGLDDARALVILLAKRETVDVVALTSCAGNVGVQQTSRNVVRILRECERLDIPVFKGSETTFANKENKPTTFFGKDGFGDVLNDDQFDFEKYINSQESASEALLRIVKENMGEISLIFIGPLTHLAMVLKLDPKFGSYLKECVVMGGSYKGNGNVTPFAEYNFHSDPEAVDYVVQNFNTPFTLIPWELSIDFQVPFVEPYNKWISKDTNKSRFLEKIGRIHTKKPESMWKFCDEIAAAFCIDPSIVLEYINVNFSIILDNEDGRRGAMVLDKDSKKGRVKMITKYDINALFRLLEEAVE